MKLKQKFTPAMLGVLAVVSTTTLSARDFCNRDGMSTNIAACLSISAPSDYQKAGLDDLVKGRFCGKADLVRDGMFRCRGDDADAVKNIMGCSSPTMLELAVNLIPESDARKPASCN